MNPLYSIVQKVIPSFNLYNLGLIECMKIVGFTEEFDFISYNVSMSISCQASGLNYIIHVIFSKVKEFHLPLFGNQVIGFSELNIYDISGRQLEGILYEVQDFGDGEIHFMCQDIAVIKIEKLEHRSRVTIWEVDSA